MCHENEYQQCVIYGIIFMLICKAFIMKFVVSLKFSTKLRVKMEQI